MIRVYTEAFNLHLEQLFFANLDWELPDVSSLLTSEIKEYIEIMDDFGNSGNLQGIYINQVHPMILAAKSAASKDDIPTCLVAGNEWSIQRAVLRSY